MSTRAVLERALEIIRDKGWCQGAYTRDGEGAGMDTVSSPQAAAWCAKGAIHRARLELSVPDMRALTVIDSVVGNDIAPWNDEPNRTRDEVIEAFKEAIVRSPLEGFDG